MRPALPSGLQPRVARAAAFLVEAGHTGTAAVAMAHRSFGKGKLPPSARALSTLRMSPDEIEAFAWSMLKRRVIAEGVLMSLSADDVRDGAVLSAHALCEATVASRRPLTIQIGGRAAKYPQIEAARARVETEIAELDAIVEAALKDKTEKPLSSKDAGPKADPRVVHLQNRLNSLGHHLQSDGVFGQVTTEAVKDFQTKIGEKPSGDVDEKTSEALRNGGKPVVDEEEVAKKRDEALKQAQADKSGPGKPGDDQQPGEAQAGSQGGSGGRGRTITVKLSEADGKGDFPMDQMPTECPKCGAPISKKTGVCQRGHHITKAVEAA